MPKYELDIPHGLSVPEAKQRLSGATRKLEQDYGATCTWKSDSELTVSRKGLDARVLVEASRVHVALSLGFLLTPFGEKIKSGIARELAGILAGPAAPPPA
jgi:putative polyhydroxyalkanoate system protein